MTYSEWSLPPPSLRLTKDTVQVWRASLQRSTTYVQSLLQTLAPDERQRAARFRFAEHRRRFIVARGVLRAILGRYLGQEPHCLEFCYSPHGKPALISTREGDRMRFNLSHSHEMVLYAFTSHREVGVDVEYIRSNVAYKEIADRFFSPREVMTLHSLPAHLQQEAFFLCWTRKEAYIKARGDGLTLPLDSFDVSLTPGDPAMLLATRDDPLNVSRWKLQHLVPGPGYVAALAVEGWNWKLSCWQWIE